MFHHSSSAVNNWCTFRSPVKGNTKCSACANFFCDLTSLQIALLGGRFVGLHGVSSFQYTCAGYSRRFSVCLQVERRQSEGGTVQRTVHGPLCLPAFPVALVSRYLLCGFSPPLCPSQLFFFWYIHCKLFFCEYVRKPDGVLSVNSPKYLHLSFHALTLQNHKIGSYIKGILPIVLLH